MKVKSLHHWFSSKFEIDLRIENDEKVIYIDCKKFDSTNANDIAQLFMFTGTNKYDLYYAKDEEEIFKIRKLLNEILYEKCTYEERCKKYEENCKLLYGEYGQKCTEIRKWIYSVVLHPKIRALSPYSCVCEECYSFTVEQSSYKEVVNFRPKYNYYNINVAKTIGQLFALFAGSCKNSNYHEYPDSVMLDLEIWSKEKMYKKCEKLKFCTKSRKFRGKNCIFIYWGYSR